MKVISGSFTITAVEDGENGVNITLDPPSIIAKINKSVAYKVNVEVYDGSTKVPHDQWSIKNSSGATSWTVTDGLSAQVFVDSENGKKGLQLNYWETFDVNTIVLFYVTYNGVDYEKSVSLSTLTNGENAIRVDLDNENDTMLYDGNGSLVSGIVTSQAYLYDGAKNITTGIEWSISGAQGVIVENEGVATNNEFDKPTSAWITPNGKLYIKGVELTTNYIQVRALYNGEYYYTQLSIKKLTNADKYELVITPNAIAYNETTKILSSSTIKVEIYRTTQNGRTKVARLSDYGLLLQYEYKNNAGGGSGQAIAVSESEYNSGYTKEISAIWDYYRFVLSKDGVVQDTETIPINKSANGADGADGADGASGISVILDLSNDNDSIIYNELGEKISSDVSTTARLYVNGVATSAFWGITGSENVDVTLPWYGYGETRNSCTITITGIASDAMSGYVEIKAEYENNIYTAKFSVTKLINQSRYELIVTPNVITANTDVTHTHTIGIEVYETTASGVRQSISSLPNSYSLFYKRNGGGDYKSGSLTYNNGSASYSYDDDCGATYISFYISQDIDSTTYLDNETISVGYVSNGADGADGADGSDGVDGNDGNTPIVVYMAAYERPNAPTTNYVNEGWSTAYPSSISGLYITHGGLWEKMSDGYYRSPIDFVKHSTEVGEAYAVEERFYFNNTTDNTIYLPFHFVSSSQYGGDYGYIIGTKNAYNQITPILSTEYDANGEPDTNDNVYSLSGIDQSLSNYTIIIPSGVSYVIFGYRKNWAGNEGEDLVKVKFGAQPVWQSTVTTKNNTFLSSTQPNKNGSTASLTQMEVKENRLLGSRFAEGRIDAWSVYNGGVSPYRFGKKNIFVRGNAAGYVQGLKQSIVNAVYKGSVYTLSFWGKGTRIRIAANVAYKRTYTIMTSGNHYGETYTDTYTPDTLIERSTIAEPTMWINGKPVQSVAGYVNGDYYSKTPDTSDTGFACALTLYSRVYTMHTVGFKVKDNFDDVSDTTIFPTTGYWTIDGTSYYASISYSFDNAIDLEFSTPDESDDYGNIQTYGFNLLMPKLEAGSYPTEFNVNDQDIAGLTGKLLYPAGVYDATKKYTADEYSAPYVAVKGTNESGGDYIYYWLNKESAQGINPITDESNTWKKFNNFQAVYADVLVADFAKLSSAVFYKDYMFSQHGANGTNYANFASENNFEEFFPNIKLDFKTGKAQFLDINIGGDATFEGTVKAKNFYHGLKWVYPENNILERTVDKEDVVIVSASSNWNEGTPIILPTPIDVNGKLLTIYNRGGGYPVLTSYGTIDGEAATKYIGAFSKLVLFADGDDTATNNNGNWVILETVTN